jgi:hypothetical protein
MVGGSLGVIGVLVRWSEIPWAKAHFKGERAFRWTEVQLPLLKQGAPTELQLDTAGWALLAAPTRRKPETSRMAF